LATDGTCKSGVFDRVFAQYGIEIFYPCSEAQSALMDVIYKGVKAGRSVWDTTLLNTEISKLLSGGAEAIVLGCTELPLAAKMYGIVGTLIDPTDILARAAITYAGYSIKE
ncbi:MAG: aspartate/glutamate racemase family protein, partial [Clostridia bacterium]|nr:aspartate/glutamate racemase family protein [Clostridia bacterium]